MGGLELRMGCALMVVIIFTLIYLVADTMSQIDACLYGFWAADDEFKKSAGIDSMFIYIGPPHNDMNRSIGFRGTTCPIWVVIKSDGAVKLNKMVSAKVRRTSYLPNSTTSYTTNHGEEMGNIIPQTVQYKHDPVTNMLIISGGTNMYGRLFKKPEPSFFCSATPNQLSAESDEATEADEANDID